MSSINITTIVLTSITSWIFVHSHILVWASILLVFLKSCCFLKERKRRMSILQCHGIPTPQPNLFWGNLRHSKFKMLPNVLFDGFLVKRFGSICGYYLGAKPMIVISDPDLLGIIQKKEKRHCLDRPRKVPGGINPDKKRRFMLGNLPIEQWKEMRKILAPAFTSHNLGAMLGSISSKVDIFMDILEGREAEEMNLYSLFQLLTLDIIGKTAFGVDSNMQTNRDDDLLLAVQAEFSKSINGFLVQVYLCLPGLVPYLTPLREGLQILKNKMGLATTSALWEAGRSALVNRRRNSAEYSVVTEQGEVYKDLLYYLTDPKKQLVDDQIIANTCLIFEAAYETTSSCLGFFVHILIHHPEAQKKIQEEIREVLDFDQDSLSTYQGLQKLKYLEACIYEALRLYPPQTTFIGRSSAVDLDYTSKDGGKYTIPTGVHIQAALYQIHRNELNWDRPNEFLPSRFLGDGKDSLKRSTYQAFGHGPRECIGKGFAMMTLKFVMATILSKYSLIPSENTEENGLISIAYKTATMTPAKGSYARVVKM